MRRRRLPISQRMALPNRTTKIGDGSIVFGFLLKPCEVTRTACRYKMVAIEIDDPRGNECLKQAAFVMPVPLFPYT
jgi:hypothetical protein